MAMNLYIHSHLLTYSSAAQIEQANKREGEREKEKMSFQIFIRIADRLFGFIRTNRAFVIGGLPFRVNRTCKEDRNRI